MFYYLYKVSKRKFIFKIEIFKKWLGLDTGKLNESPL